MRHEFFTKILKSPIKVIDIREEKMTESHILKSSRDQELVVASYKKSGTVLPERQRSLKLSRRGRC